jgi:hypothetical protein
VSWFTHEADIDEAGIPALSISWHLWQQRLLPFRRLAVGDRIFLVSRGGPEAGRVTAEVRVTGLVAERYESKEHAWKLLRSGLRDAVVESKLTRSGFLGHWYTSRAPDEGWLLAVSRERVRELDKPRPDGMRFPRHGWFEAADPVKLG